MNKQFFLLLSVIALVPGCFNRQKKSEKRPVDAHEIMTDVDIPVAQSNVKTFFDEDIDDLALEDNVAGGIETADGQYAWIEKSARINKDGFRTVYFDFDKYSIRSTEKDSVAQDVARMQNMLAKEGQSGKRVKFVINGHACDSAGNRQYNHILSENRAKTLKDCAVAAGIPADRITIVGRGSDFPAVINGKPCNGDRDQQAPNRRDEIQVIALA
jgi:outer membrane protein OmpA-like peptidoglycan-associated protein